MAAYLRAPYYVEDRFGVTIAVALVLRIEGRLPHKIDVERWVHEIDALIVPLFDADPETPVGIAIRVSERDGKRIAEDLILDAAVACPTYFERARDEREIRTIAHFDAPRGRVTN